MGHGRQESLPARGNAMFRNRKILIPYLLLVAALAGVLLWHQGRQQPIAAGTVISTGTATVGGDFTLTDQTGARRSSTTFRGKYMLVYFGFTSCPDVCPTTLAVMAEALDGMGPAKDKVVPVFITIDPERDTVGLIKNYMEGFGPSFVGFTGTVQEIEAVKKLYRVYGAKKALDEEKGMAAGYGMDHSSVMYLMGPNGRIVTYWDDLIPVAKLEAELQANVK
jgi:cytochrome oxidase Cu insertion factor (SCO1/SenC/PrrC family)